MKGVILAGGLGTRLHPLTKVTNKHLLPVGREPMIFHPVKKLTEAATEPLAREIVTTGRELGVQRDIHYGLHFLGDCGLWRGNGAEAADWYRQSLCAALAYGNVAEAAVEMEGLAMALAAQGRTELAVQLDAAARAKMAALGYSVDGVEFWSGFRQRYLLPARLALGERASAVEAQGRALAWEAAVALALAASVLARAAAR